MLITRFELKEVGLRQRLIPARRNIAPVRYTIIDGPIAICVIGQRELAIRDLTARGTLLDVIPVSECVLVLDLDILLAGERNAPVRIIHTGQRRTARIPLRQIAIQLVKEPGDVHAAPGGVCRGRMGHQLLKSKPGVLPGLLGVGITEHLLVLQLD